jgi:DNA-3-methyladenine glycosylase II
VSIAPPTPERVLSARDKTLACVIQTQSERWSSKTDEHPIWGLVRIVMAQQVSTLVAWRIAERARAEYPGLASGLRATPLDVARLREFGLPQSRAQCCALIVERSEDILYKVQSGISWEESLAGIKGIGPWTTSIFRIMVLRHPDVLPIGDIGLQRAIKNVYGRSPRSVGRFAAKWRPYRSVACWYLWRTLGNRPLG